MTHPTTLSTYATLKSIIIIIIISSVIAKLTKGCIMSKRYNNWLPMQTQKGKHLVFLASGDHKSDIIAEGECLVQTVVGEDGNIVTITDKETGESLIPCLYIKLWKALNLNRLQLF